LSASISRHTRRGASDIIHSVRGGHEEQEIMRNARSIAAVVAAAASLAHVAPVAAQTATFQVDPAASSLTVSGTAAGQPVQQQGPGSLTTTYTGPLLVQLSPGSISFPGGSAVTANNSGNWQPLPGGEPGAAPANYGARVVILFQNNLAAVRDAVFDGTTPAPFILTGSGNNREFSSDIDFTSTSGQIDYNSPLAGNGTDTIVGSTATNQAGTPASLLVSAGTAGFANAALQIPVSFTIPFDLGTFGSATFDFDGSITARASARGGDANFDGAVSLDDFNTLAANFGTTSGAGWLQGDFTFDGNVNLDDFNALAANFGISASTNGPTPGDWTALGAAVPEPASLGLLALATLPALRRRRNA
jgi:hypothetical protein